MGKPSVRSLSRRQTVTPRFVHTYDGIVEITWAGSGGYWQRARLNVDGEWITARHYPGGGD